MIKVPCENQFFNAFQQCNIFQLFITFHSCLPFNAKDAIFTPDALQAFVVLRSREIV